MASTFSFTRPRLCRGYDFPEAFVVSGIGRSKAERIAKIRPQTWMNSHLFIYSEKQALRSRGGLLCCWKVAWGRGVGCSRSALLWDRYFLGTDSEGWTATLDASEDQKASLTRTRTSHSCREETVECADMVGLVCHQHELSMEYTSPTEHILTWNILALLIPSGQEQGLIHLRVASTHRHLIQGKHRRHWTSTY